MKHRDRIAVLVLALFLAAGCSTFAGRTPYDTAALSYVEASIAYEAAMPLVQSARAQHLIDDAAWARVEVAQHQVAAVSTQVHAALLTWHSAGTKPAIVDALLRQLLAAVADVVKIQQGVKP